MEELKNPDSSSGLKLQEEAPQAAANGEPAADVLEVSSPEEQLAALAADRDRLAAEKAELEDMLRRRQAEFENFRKRVDREKAELVEYAGMRIIQDLLPVVDDFERALKMETADREYSRGIELIYQRLMDHLKKAGLEPMEALGAKFDPNLHHAVERFATADQEEETVLEEYQRGYHFRGRLLRPAMVKVAVRP